MNSRSRPFLADAEKFVTGNGVLLRDMCRIIDNAPIKQLIPIFTMLKHSLMVRVREVDTDDEVSMRQSLFHLLMRITAKVPPLFLLDTSQVLSKSGCSYPLLADVDDAIMKRLSGTTRKLWAERCSDWSSPVFELILRKSGSRHEFGVSSDVIDALKYRFISMILSGVPAGDFRLFMMAGNTIDLRSVRALTDAVLKIIRKLNRATCYTQSELLYSFAHVFMYIHTFIASQAIDCNRLSEEILALPYISPFCLFAMRNNIQHLFKLFAMLNPLSNMKGTITRERAMERINECYRIVDMSCSSELSRVTEAMPRILLDYFLVVAPTGEPEPVSCVESIIVSHCLNPGPPIGRVKRLVNLAERGLIDACVVTAFDEGIVHGVLRSFRKVFYQCYNKGILQEGMRRFLKTVIAMVGISGRDAVSRILSLKDESGLGPQHAIDILLRWILRTLTYGFMRENTQKQLVPYCIQAISSGNSLFVAPRVIISMLLNSAAVNLDDVIVAALSNCIDPCILLEYAAAIDNEWRSATCEHVDRLARFRSDLILRRMQETLLTFEDGPSGLVITGTVPDFEALTVPATDFESLRYVASISQDPSILSRDTCDDVGSIRILLQHKMMENEEFASKITRQLVRLLLAADNSRNRIAGPGNTDEQFPFYLRDAVIPVAQYHIRRTVELGYSNLARDVFFGVKEAFLAHTLILPWIAGLVRNVRSVMSQELKIDISRLVFALPLGEQYIRTNVSEMIALLQQNEVVYGRPPDSLITEYPCPYHHILDFNASVLLLSERTDGEIVDELVAVAMEVISPGQGKRSAVCRVTAQFVARMPTTIGLSFAERLLQNPTSIWGTKVLRMFMMFCHINIMLSVCSRIPKLVESSLDTLNMVIDAVVPCCLRLTGNREAVVSLVRSIRNIPVTLCSRRMRERVDDAAAFIIDELQPGDLLEL